MKFNIVIGNPPYNNDLYIPFVENGHKLSTDCSEFITPAKWQAKGGYINEHFRETIVPHMSKIVFYPDCTDVFDIQDGGGISYYIVNKTVSRERVIKSICNKNKRLNSEWEEHDESNVTLYNKAILNIINKVSGVNKFNNNDGCFKQSLYIKNTDRGIDSICNDIDLKRQVFISEQDRGNNKIANNSDYVEVMQGSTRVGYKLKCELFSLLGVDKFKCICPILAGCMSIYDESGKTFGMIKLHCIGPNQVPKGSFPVLKYFDTKNECKSFISFLNTKLMSFMFYIGICGVTLTKEFFRYIPDIINYDHIFTDQELYKKYGLTEDEINIIESTIKSRV